MFHRFFCFLKRSLLTVLLVLLLLLLAAGGWFVYQGRQLYQSAASVTPIATLYDTISSRTHYAAYDQLPQTFVQAVICTEDEHFMTPGPSSGRCCTICAPGRWPRAAAPSPSSWPRTPCSRRKSG